ncbi:MAG: Shikimate 5-dehydrogenase C-terminal domain, partial [Pseudomonadota bacterium]
LLDHDVIVSYMNRNQNRLETFPDCLRDRIYNGEAVDLVINSTPPIASEYILTKILTEEINLQPNPLFVDLSYKNSLINNQDIKSRFLSSIDGLGMLVFQAALSFKIWFGIEVDPYLVISELVDERD